MDAIRSAVVLVFAISLYFSSTGGWAVRQMREDMFEFEVPASLEIDEDMAEELWLHCRLDLMQMKEEIKIFGIFLPEEICTLYTDFGAEGRSRAKIHLQKIVNELPPEMIETLLGCLGNTNTFHFLVSGKEGDVSQKWFTQCLQTLLGWHTFERRELINRPLFGSKELNPSPAPAPSLLLGQPSHSPAPSPSPLVGSPGPSPPEEEWSFSPDPPDSVEPSDDDSLPQTPPSVRPHVPSKKHDVASSERPVVVAVIVTAVGTFSLVALLFCCYQQKTRNNSVFSADEHKDERPLLVLSTSDLSVGSLYKGFTLGNAGDNEKIEELSFKSNQSSLSTEMNTVKPSSLPPPPAAVAAALEAAKSSNKLPTNNSSNPPQPRAPPVPPPQPRAPPPMPPPPPPTKHKPPPCPAPAPPPIPSGIKPGHGPPPQPPKAAPLPPRSSLASKTNHAPPPVPNLAMGQGLGAQADDSKPKLKPFFWDKVLANPDQSMVWHQIKSGSFQFNEEMMENLFGYNKPIDTAKGERKKESPSFDQTNQFVKILDPKKSQNLSILIRALNVTVEEVCDALKEGNELPTELLQTFLKMPPTTDEELKLRLYCGELAQLLPAERFLKALVDIPFAFKRMDALLYMTTFQEEISGIMESFDTLQVACKELQSSRLFLKLLEAVLKTGNRMNNGTFRGGAQAFKLDTLLKLADVKGTDGKTTLLHFVVQEIIRTEGIRRVRSHQQNLSISSINSEDFGEDPPCESIEQYHTLGLQVVAGVSGELENVKKAALLDADNLSATIGNLSQGLVRIKEFLNKELKNLEDESGFQRSLESFVEHIEGNVTCLLEEDKKIRILLKNTADYFHGSAGKDDGLRLFAIVRDFLSMVDKVCSEVKEVPKKVPKTPINREAPGVPPIHDPRQVLFPAIKVRRMGTSSSDSSSDDE